MVIIELTFLHADLELHNIAFPWIAHAVTDSAELNDILRAFFFSLHLSTATQFP